MMKRVVAALLQLAIVCSILNTSLYAQNISVCGSTGGVNMVGSMQGYSQPINCSVNYRVLTYRKVSTTAANPTDGRGQWKTTCNAQSSGGDFGLANMAGGGGGGGGFLLTNGDVCGNTGQYTRKWVFPSAYQATLNAINPVNYYTSGGSDMGANMGTAGRYTIVLQDIGCANSSYYFAYTANAPVTLSFGAQVLNGDGSYTIPITTSAVPSAGETIFVRYRLSTNDFTASTFLVQATGSGTSWSATIPAVATGTTVYYYAFTSTRSLANLNADNESNRSLSALNFLDNSGNNYSYLQSIVTGPILVTGTAPASSAYYSSLTLAAGAFAAINAGTHKGSIAITILSDVTTESGLNPLYQSGYLGTSSYTGISIQPSGARTIRGSSTSQLLDLNGCDNVSINGLNSGGNSLIIENTSTTASNGTIRFINDATQNTITNCTLKGSSNQSNAAVIYFSSADGTLQQGNDNNTISNNVIRESSGGDPLFGINSFGSSGAPNTKWNSNNTLSNNQILNVFAPNTAICAAIQLTNGANTDWTITGNSIYWTTTKSSTGASADYVYGIRITGGNGSNFSITNNYIGGMAANCGGSPMTISNTTFGNKISGIDINVATAGTASNIQGNTIANIFLSSNSNKGTAPYIFSGIVVESGLVNIGTTAGNTIGSATVSGSITLSSAATGAGGVVCGIGMQGASSNCVINNNSVSGFTLLNASGVRSTSIYGININAGSASVTGNQIGNASLPNSIINFTGMGAVDLTYMVAINQSAASTVSSISNNYIANITHNATGSNVFLWGISNFSSSSSPLISGNTIRNLLYMGTGSSNDGMVGIYSNASEIISGNTIYSLVQASATSDADIAGIYAPGTGTPTIRQNTIYSIINNNKATNYTYGIIVTASNAALSNNMISLGTSVTSSCSFRGISIENTGTYTVYYNSIVITGASSGTNADSYGLSVLSGTVTSRNNIFYNDRSPGNTGSKCYYYALAVNSDYNDFYAGPGNAIANTYTTLSAYQLATSLDLNSKNIQPVFTAIASDLHLAAGNCGLYGVGIAIGITIDIDGETRKNPPDLGADENNGAGGISWIGTVSSDWHLAANWCPPIVPTAAMDVVIPSPPVNQPLISNADAVCKNITINAGAAHLDMANSRNLTLSATAVFTNNGAFNCGAVNEQVIFAGAGTIAGSASTTFRRLTLNGGTTISTVPSINLSLQLNTSSFVSAAPNYGSSSTLIYNTGGSYGVANEWTGTAVTAGTGVPNHVTIQNSTTLNMPNSLRGMAGDLLISSGTLAMNGTSGADLNIAGNWTRSSSAGFTPNSRAIRFKGTSDQTITVTGGGTEVFAILVIDKPNAGTYLKPSSVAGNLTHIRVNGNMASNVAVLQFINNGSLDLNGRIFYLDGNNSSSYPGHIYVNGARTIYNSGGINSGSFSIMSSTNPNQPNWYTRSVWNNAGTGTLTFNQDVLVTLADGRMDWGLDANNVNITTIQGVLQINLGGSVVYNSCYYSSTPPSTLRFANTIDYQVNPGDKTWAFGAIYSGLAGIPYNVEVNNTNTDLTINEVRALRNNLTITDGRLTLNSGPFNIGGNWTRTNPAGITIPPCAFIPNSNKVVFDKTGAGDQLISCTANGNVETFYDLDISPATVNVQLAGATEVVVTNNLVLTSGKVDLNSNRLTLGTAASSGSLTGGSATAYIMAYNGSTSGTFRRYNSALSLAYLFPLGDNSNYTPMSLTYNTGTTLSTAYTDAKLYAVAHPQIGTATTYITRYWPLTPNGVSTPNYDVVYTYADADVVGIEGNLFPFKYNPYGWVGSGGSGAYFMQGTGSVNPATNTLSWSSINSFSEFTGIGNGTPLPIQLLYFGAEWSQNHALIQWTTVTEINNDYFTLERSWNGFDFEVINQQKGAGNSTSSISYFYPDYAIANNARPIVYYRLKQTDFNGKYSYSKTVALRLNAANENSFITAYPNPFVTDLWLNFFAEEHADAQLEIYDMSGKKMINRSLTIEPNSNKIYVGELNEQQAGLYAVHLICNQKTYSIIVVKK